jgi:diadenosine tetraphosphate (Ap4A) HIT family hydrolase
LASGSSTTNLPEAHIGNIDIKSKPRPKKTAKHLIRQWRTTPLRGFLLDSRLANDSVSVSITGLCDLRLMRDRRWPWLVLIPRRAGISEIFDLTPLDQVMLTFETNLVAAALKTTTGAAKINVGALGNIVRQLHVHVIARFEGDPNWPGPVWGYGKAEPYSNDDMRTLVARLQEALSP